MVRCPTCHNPVARIVAGLVVMVAHVRGGQKRAAEGAQLTITCEVCGTRMTARAGYADLPIVEVAPPRIVCEAVA